MQTWHSYTKRFYLNFFEEMFIIIIINILNFISFFFFQSSTNGARIILFGMAELSGLSLFWKKIPFNIFFFFYTASISGGKNI